MERQAGDRWENLTAAALRHLEGEGRPLSNDAKPATLVAPAPAAKVASSGVLRYRVTLNAPAVFPKLGGNPFTVPTSEYIPGAVVKGVLAGRYLSRSVADDLFYRLFTEGVEFRAAVPAGKRGPLAPLPHSLRQTKNETRHYDLAMEPAPTDDALKREGAGWCDLDQVRQGLSTEKVDVSTELAYHHARSDDPRIQRAIGQEDKAYGAASTGAFFTYEFLLPGQTFQGEIHGPPDRLDIIRGLLADGAEVRLGRSRGAQYGGSGKWEWLAAMPQAEPAEPARCVVVTLLTPLVNVNQFGHPAPEFPIAEIGAALGDASARVEQQFVRVEWVAGYLSHQGLPRHQMPALAAGSVFVLTLANPGQFADAGRRCWLGNNPSQIPISGKLCQTLSEIRISVLPSCPCPTSASAPGDPCPGGRKCSKHSAIPDPSWKWQDAASSARGLTEGPASPFRAQPCPACGVPVTLLAAFCTRCDEPILR